MFFGLKLVVENSYVLNLSPRKSFGILETFFEKLGIVPKNSQNYDF